MEHFPTSLVPSPATPSWPLCRVLRLAAASLLEAAAHLPTSTVIRRGLPWYEEDRARCYPTLRIIFKDFFFVFLPNIMKPKPILTFTAGRYAKDFTGGIWVTRKVFTEAHFFMCVFTSNTSWGNIFVFTYFYSVLSFNYFWRVHFTVQQMPTASRGSCLAVWASIVYGFWSMTPPSLTSCNSLAQLENWLLSVWN